MEKKKHFYSIRMLCLVFCLLGLMAVSGCGGDDDDDDESTIQIVNEDSHNYVVDLFRSGDDKLIDTKAVDQWPQLDSVDYFENVDKGVYYLTITRKGESVIRAWSRTFKLDGEETLCFVITTTGQIEDC